MAKIREVFETGLNKEFKESGMDNRDPVEEFTEDYAVLESTLDILESDLEQVLQVLKKQQKSPDILTQAEIAHEGLKDFKKRLSSIGQQGELFDTEHDENGRSVSVKLKQLKQVKEQLRDWYTIVGGIKNLKEKITHEFSDVESLRRNALAVSPEGREQHYGRSFNKLAAEWENVFKDEFNMEVALCNSGMSAIETSLEAAALKPGDAILIGKNFYPHTKTILKELSDKGILVIEVDINDVETVRQKISEHKPKLVVFEGIGNDVAMATAPLNDLLRHNSNWNSQTDVAPYRLLIDNTFATPGLVNISERIKELKLTGVKWAAVESATKYFQQGMDNITAGLIYSDDPEFINSAKTKRRNLGEYLQQRLINYLPRADAEIIENKIIRHSMNAMLLATHLERLGLEVSYPGLASHEQSDIATANYPKGLGGVFYFKWDNLRGNPQSYVNRVKSEAEKLGSKVKIGVSFGHQETWIETLPPDWKGDWEPGDTRVWSIRVMAGEENIAEIKNVMRAFEVALN